MRTKLFLAFVLVILIALISNLIFERLIMRDFDEYTRGTREDHLYWVLAAMEGSYQDGRWDMNLLSEAVHWGMMLGFDIRVEDKEGREITNSHRVMDSLPPMMKRRMESIIHSHSAEGEYEQYPLYAEGSELGTLSVRSLKKEGPLKVKGTIFKERGRNFLIISFLIAGISAVAMAIFLSLTLSRPVRRLKIAAERVAKGDFSARVTSVSRDEIGRLSESFNYMAEALQKEELLRKRLTSNIAHELRTPLAVMRAQAEAMIDGVVENKGEGLENIRNEIEKLTRLVEGIEDLTKAEASFFSQGEERRINLKEFLKGTESSMEPIFREKGLQFSVVDRGDMEVTADLDKLERILKNIISNSLKYTGKGGVWIDYGREGREFFMEVRDTGIGIPEDEMPKIFMRFYRGRGAVDRGVGIGLALVKELVDVIGGRIEVKSKVAEGTAIRVWLPIKI
ncbi:MAG: HAMP domain-containing histidine kinase [Nitrospirae bacterium]|nr:HAMP domain-containing histidine kinase [Nitrospirota bacterium]MCL5421080.1 HAMP domain-containing histidine kinase [Nitrospirota bacterium]